VVCAWGVIVVIDAGNAVMCLKEKDLAFKLELLFNKSLYMVALNLATSGKVCHDPCDPCDPCESSDCRWPAACANCRYVLPCWMTDFLIIGPH
jgi:hypothetical protein